MFYEQKYKRLNNIDKMYCHDDLILNCSSNKN